MIVTFHLSDKCNIRCKDCHWFSEKVNINKNPINYIDYINWINKNKHLIHKIKLSGGEPTLYPYFLELINNIDEKILVRVNSNGTNIDILKNIKKKNVELMISKNRKVDVDFEENIKKLNIRYKIVNFNTETPTLKNEVEFGNQIENLTLINKECICIANEIRFASDGYVYNCESGLRSKDINLRTGLSLWEGKLENYNKFQMNCIIKKSCLSNFLNENSYQLID